MLKHIPLSESLKDTKARSNVYWNDVIAPALKANKTLLVVGHENNLRSILMHLEGIAEDDIINLSLPRAVPLAYRLDANLKPMDRPDGKLDDATGFLRGEWLGGDAAVAEILARDHKQVYDTSIEANLETTEKRHDWNSWIAKNSKACNYDVAMGTGTGGQALSTAGNVVPGVNHDYFMSSAEQLTRVTA
jgi:hypothetical protein